jgi:hypothetical protein
VRVALALILVLAGPARGDDVLGVGAAVGAGGQGTATYGALDLTLDAEWHGARLGLGARGVWLDGDFRASDWDHASDAVTVLRLLEVHSAGGAVALAAGALAPAQLAHVADGYRAALDDHRRTGVRAVATTQTFALGLEVDDVLSPALAGGAAALQVTPAWSARAAAAVDPTRGEATTELALARTWSALHARTEVGGGLVYEPGFGASALAFAGIERDAVGARWRASADVRAGTGSVGAAFGPLYRLERAELWQHSETGAGAGASASVAASRGWITASVRVRPGRGVIGAVSAGAPMGRWLQAGAWAAASRDAAAGAGELRVAWAKRLSSALQIARMYDTDVMTPSAQWSVTAWFGATSN